MADTLNYGWTKPTVGGDFDAWGTKLNVLADDADADVKTVENLAAAALPKAGGVLTGRVDAHTGTIKRVDKGSISGSHTIELSAGQYHTATITGATTFTAFNGAPAGALVSAIILRLTNAGTQITWPTAVKWPGGTAPTLTGSGVDILAFVSDDNGTTWRLAGMQKDLR